MLEAERPEQFGDVHETARPLVGLRLDRKELPNAVARPMPPGSQCNEFEFEQPVECATNSRNVHAECLTHTTSAVERGAATVCGKREEKEHGSGIRPELGEPPVVE